MRSKSWLSGLLLAAALAPSWTLKDLSGKTLSSKDFAGRVVLLDFFATWCPDCVKSAPVLQAEHESGKARGLSVVGVLVEDDAKDAAKLAKEKGLTYPIVVDSRRKAFSAFGVRGIPTTVLIDARGRERARWFGALDPKSVDAALAPLLAAAPRPAPKAPQAPAGKRPASP